MLRSIYSILFVASSAIGLMTVTFIFFTLRGVDETSGNAGAFVSFLSIGAGLAGLVFVTIFAGAAAIVAYVFEDQLPRHWYYKFWLPTLFASPGLVLLTYNACSGVRDFL